MAFVSSYLLKGKPLKLLPLQIKIQTQIVLKNSIANIEGMTSGEKWHYPNPLEMLTVLDHISNECCKIIDSATILYKHYNDENEELSSALLLANDTINDFFGGQYLNQNKRLLA